MIDCVKNPLISIIVPVYNVEAYLPRCIDSILNQKEKNFELILIDDGSKDSSGAICDRYAEIDSRLKVIHKENGGVSSARNLGLDNAIGEWVWFIDADDDITADSMSVLIDAIEKYECDTIFSGLIQIMADGRELRDQTITNTEMSKEEFLNFKFAYQNGMILFSRNVIEDNGLRFNTDIKIGEDLEFQYYYLIHCRRPISIDSCVYNYYHRAGSAMTSPSSRNRRMNDSLIIVSRLAQLMKNEKCEMYPWLSRRLNLMLKAGMKAASQLNENNRRDYVKQLRLCVRHLRESGYISVIDNTIRLVLYTPWLYFMLIRLKIQ